MGPKLANQCGSPRCLITPTPRNTVGRLTTDNSMIKSAPRNTISSVTAVSPLLHVHYSVSCCECKNSLRIVPLFVSTPCCTVPVVRRVVKLKVKSDESVFDPAVQADILKLVLMRIEYFRLCSSNKLKIELTGQILKLNEFLISLHVHI